MRRTHDYAAAAAPLILAGGLAAFAGVLVSGRGQNWTGQTVAYFFLAAMLALAVLGIFTQLGSLSLLAWPLLSAVAYPWIRFPRGNPVVTFDRVWITGLLAYLAIGDHRPRRQESRFAGGALVAFAVVYGLRAFSTSNVVGILAAWVDAIVLPVVLFFAARKFSTTPDRTRSLAAAAMVAGGVLGGIGLAERVLGFQLASLSGGTVRIDVSGVGHVSRISGTYTTAEIYALVLVICLGATLYWLQTRVRGSVWVGIVAAALEVGGSAFSLFRAAWIAALLVIIGSFAIRPRRFGRAFATTLLIAAAVLAASSQLQSNAVFKKRTTDTANIYSRLATWHDSIHIWRSEPVFGVGVGRYKDAALARTPSHVNNVPAEPYPHNSFIGVLAEQGIVGFIPMAVAAIAVWRLSRRLRREAVTPELETLAGTLSGVALGYLIMSLTLQMLPFGPSNAFFALFVGACAGRLDALRPPPAAAPQ